MLNEPKEMIKGLIPVFEELIKEGYPDCEFETSDIEDFIKERVRELISPPAETVSELGTEPESVQFTEHPRKMEIRREVLEIRKSYEILINTANWLIKKGKLKPTNCPVGMGHKRNLINREPKHKYGDSFTAPKKLSNRLWIETHYSTAHCINNARRLLERFGYQGNILEVR